MKRILIAVALASSLRAQPIPSGRGVSSVATVPGSISGTGTITTAGTTTIVGVGTTFTSLRAGQWLVISGESAPLKIASITNATHLTLASAAGSTASGLSWSYSECTYGPVVELSTTTARLSYQCVNGLYTAIGSGGGSGTVTSVAATVPSFMAVSGSPIATSGTLGFSFASQTQNLFLASPNGSSGAPVFRALVAADVPVLGYIAKTGTTTGAQAVVQGTGTSGPLASFTSSDANAFPVVEISAPSTIADFSVALRTTGTDAIVTQTPSDASPDTYGIESHMRSSGGDGNAGWFEVDGAAISSPGTNNAINALNNDTHTTSYGVRARSSGGSVINAKHLTVVTSPVIEADASNLAGSTPAIQIDKVSGTATIAADGTMTGFTFVGNVPTATSLAANGTNCLSGNANLGSDASGNAEGCFAVVIPTRSVSTSSPLGGGGALSADLTLTCTTCATSSNDLSFFSSTTSAQLRGLISDEQGTGGGVVFATGPTITSLVPTFTDVTTGNVSTSAHGLVPKADNNAAHYLDGTGAFSTPSGAAAPLTLTTPNGSTTPLTLSNTGATGNGLLCLDGTAGTNPCLASENAISGSNPTMKIGNQAGTRVDLDVRALHFGGGLSLTGGLSGALALLTAAENAFQAYQVSKIYIEGTTNDHTTCVDNIVAGVAAFTDCAASPSRRWVQTGGTARNTAQFDKTSATLANVTGLSLTLIAGRTYVYRAYIPVTADAVGGYKVAIAGTATTTAFYADGIATNIGGAALGAAGRATTIGSSILNASVGTTIGIVIEGQVTVNAAGTLTVQFAQNTASGTSSVLIGGSLVAVDNQ